MTSSPLSFGPNHPAGLPNPVELSHETTTGSPSETHPMRSFSSLSEREVLALAISLEEEDARIYDDFAEGLKADYPATAETFKTMRAQEDGHRHRLIELYRQKFGEHIPLLRRQDVKGFVHRKPVWLVRPLGIDA